MHRRFTDAPTIRRDSPDDLHQVNNGQEIYVIGAVLEDGTVRGGTGWGAEFAKRCATSRCTCSIRQEQLVHVDGRELGEAQLRERSDHHPPTFSGTGTRTLIANGKRAIEDLFNRSFGG